MRLWHILLINKFSQDIRGYRMKAKKAIKGISILLIITLLFLYLPMPGGAANRYSEGTVVINIFTTSHLGDAILETYPVKNDIRKLIVTEGVLNGTDIGWIKTNLYYL